MTARRAVGWLAAAGVAWLAVWWLLRRLPRPQDNQDGDAQYPGAGLL